MKAKQESHRLPWEYCECGCKNIHIVISNRFEPFVISLYDTLDGHIYLSTAYHMAQTDFFLGRSDNNTVVTSIDEANTWAITKLKEYQLLLMKQIKKIEKMTKVAKARR